jgi:CBS domain containing-hemolysin-like protein
MTGILVVGSLTLLASFLCSLFEAVLYSITPSQIEVQKLSGRAGAKRLARMRANVEAPIAAILTVNTIAHTAGAAWCGAMAGEEFGNAAVGVFAAVFTVLVLALTEIVPKSLGVRYARQLGVPIVWPLQVMIWSVLPIVWLATLSMHRLTGAHRSRGPSEEEVLVFSRLAEQGGSVRSDEATWVENALRLDKFTAGDLRTPRTVVESQLATATVGELADNAGNWIHSRVPVTGPEGLDDVQGLVHRREVLDAAIGRRLHLTLADLMHPITFVPETMPAHRLLEMFLRERKHLAAVADEYGGFEGVVTLEDVVECLLGAEIVDEHDEIEDMQKLAQERNRFANEEEEPTP